MFDSTALFIILFLIPAILLLLAASTIFHKGKHTKSTRFISYMVGLLSSVLFIEWIRHVATEPVSFTIHALISNPLTIGAFCLLSNVCYMLTVKHSRYTIRSAPVIFYLPFVLYVVLFLASFQLNNMSIQQFDEKNVFQVAVVLSISAIVSIVITIGILVKGIKYAPSPKRKRLYSSLCIILGLATIIIFGLTYAKPSMLIYEPVLYAALFTTLFLLLNIRNITFSASLKRNYKMIVDVSPVAITVLDADFNILEVNPKAKDMFKFSVGTALQQYFQGPLNETAIIQCLQMLQQKKALHDYQFTYYVKNRTEPTHLSIDAVLIYVDHTHNYYFMIRDVTKEREQELLNYHLAYHDPLTDLHNRAYFVSNVESSLRQIDSSHRSALVLIDINFFKPINDTYGHQIGDLVLVHIAHVLKEHAKTASIIARLGGDEFVLYYNVLQSIQSFDEEIEAVRKAFKEQLFTFDDLSFEVVPSFGHAIFPTDARTFEALYHIADTRMYDDKRIIKEQYNKGGAQA